VVKSVLEAIESGDWNYEPDAARDRDFQATNAIPGSPEKLQILAWRIQSGLPLWHPNDRHASDPHADARSLRIDQDDVFTPVDMADDWCADEFD
jgi:hypothetical protein